jgi:hypothetical protein
MEFIDEGCEWPDCRHQFENGIYAGCIEEQWKISLIAAAAETAEFLSEQVQS